MSNLHKKLIIHTVAEYLHSALQGEPYQKDKLRAIKSKIDGYVIFHKFSPQEAKILIDLGKDEFMEQIKRKEVDFGVFGIELLSIFYDNVPTHERGINMSQKKVAEHKTKMIMDMLHLKKDDDKRHTEVKDIITNSRIVAKQFYTYTAEKLKETAQ